MLGFLLAAQLVIPGHVGLMNDQAHVLPPATVQRVEQQLRDFEKQTTIEFAVLTVTDLQGISVEEFAEKVFQAWGIGKKGRDNGLLFVLATKDRKMRFEVGYGLEQSFPDGRAGLVLRDIMRPHFANGDWAGGITAGVDATIQYLQNPAVPQEPVSQKSGGFSVGLVIFLILLAVAIGIMLYFMFRTKKEEEEPETTDYDNRGRNYSYSPPVSSRRDEPPVYVAPSRSSSDDYQPASSSSSPSSDYGSSSGGGGFDFGGGSSGGGGASSDF